MPTVETEQATEARWAVYRYDNLERVCWFDTKSGAKEWLDAAASHPEVPPFVSYPAEGEGPAHLPYTVPGLDRRTLTNARLGWLGPIPALGCSPGADFEGQALRDWLPNQRGWLKVIAAGGPAQYSQVDVVQSMSTGPRVGIACALVADEVEFERIAAGAVDLAWEQGHARPAKELEDAAHIAYDLEQAFDRVHLNPSVRDVRNFWTSLNAAQHIRRACPDRLISSELLSWIGRYVKELEAGTLPAAALPSELVQREQRIAPTVPAVEDGGTAVVSGEDNVAESPKLRRGRPRTKPNCHPEVEPFLDDVSKVAQRQITIEEFCQVSGFGDDTTFGFWRSGNTERCSKVHEKHFEATLKLTPADFLSKAGKVTPKRR